MKNGKFFAGHTKLYILNKKLLPMEQGLRYMNTILVFLTVGLLIFSAYPMIVSGGLTIVILIFVLAGIVALATFIYTGEFKRES